nr:ATP-binding cassette domain-containing protein [Streptomyces sp. gb1(2016)]
MFTAIMGPSGSGKSTLMHCVAGLDSFSSGSVRIGETELGTLKDKQLTKLRRDKIGFIFQAFNLLPTLTALETELGTLKDKQLTKLRRDKIGFIFQAFNLLPTLTALGRSRWSPGPARASPG